MRVEVFTIFPEMVSDYAGRSILSRAAEAGLLELLVHDLRGATSDVHRSVDDAPFGGGPGMVLMPEPVFTAVESAQAVRPLFLLGPAGRRFDHSVVAELAVLDGFSLLCGRYEGVDDRIRTDLCDGEFSIGDFVLAGGELAALMVVEAVARLRPGVLGNEASTGDESFTDGLLEYPQFTRPAEFRGLEVPEVLRSGDHKQVERWRHAAALSRTLAARPDLMEHRGGLSDDDLDLLAEFGFDS